MKKQILMLTTALMLTAGVACGMNHQEAQAASKKVAISKKNFPDMVFRELVKSNYDKNKDNKLSKSEIKKATSFGTSSRKTSIKYKPSKYAKYTKKYVKDIKSFKGITKLTNLKRFRANGTSVKTVNFKKCKNLYELEMTEGKLQNLDLNSNKKLKYVYLQYNQLTTLKMNKCKKLVKVNLTGHMVKNLKIDRNKSTDVIGENYYKPYAETVIKNDFVSLNEGGSLDANGNYCIYEWAADYSQCSKKVLLNGTMSSTVVNLNSETINKTKAVQQITAQWTDKTGNFYFIADKDGDMVSQTVNYLYKVNPQGAIESEVKINDQMIVQNYFFERYHLYFMNQKENVVTLKMTTGSSGQYGVLYFDMNTMKMVKQVECTFEPTSAEDETIVGSNGYSVIVGKALEGTPYITETKQEINVFKMGSSHQIPKPMRNGYSGYSTVIQNNYVYFISAQGFYKAKLTADKFTQIYGIGKITGMQDPKITYSMVMKNEKEIYMLFSKTEDEKTTYSLSKCAE